jgi:hypothetical protein
MGRLAARLESEVADFGGRKKEYQLFLPFKPQEGPMKTGDLLIGREEEAFKGALLLVLNVRKSDSVKVWWLIHPRATLSKRSTIANEKLIRQYFHIVRSGRVGE